LKGAGCRKLILTGGEPLLRCDLEEIVGAATAAGIGVDLNSNLFGLTPHRATGLADAGLREVSVSFYGDRAFHDVLVRRDGAYKSTMESCCHLRTRGVDLDVHGALWDANLPLMQHMLELAESLGAASLTFFKVIGLSGNAGNRLFGTTRFGASAARFAPPALSDLSCCLEGLRRHGTIPIRMIGFHGTACSECEQGRSIVGLTASMRLLPCLLSRRQPQQQHQVDGENISRMIRVVREEVQRGLWTPVCEV